METNNKPLEITQQQINLMAAGVLMIAFFSFLTGYLSMPNRTTPLDTIDPMHSSHTAAGAINHGYSYRANRETPAQENSTANARNEKLNPTPTFIGSYFPLNRKTASHEMPNQQVESTSNSDQNDKSDKEYYASVAGFGTVEAARICKERLLNLGIATEIITRTSATVSGVIRTWYQLITSRGNQKEIEQRARRIQSIIPTVSVERIQP